MNVALYVDSTHLKPGASQENDIVPLIVHASRNNMRGICVHNEWLLLVKQVLQRVELQHRPIVSTVIDFPYGASTTISRLKTINDISHLCNEVDVVVKLSTIKNREWHVLNYDLKKLSWLGIPIKLIIEMNLLTDDEIKRTVEFAISNKIFCIKTGTGTAGPTTVNQIKLLKSMISNNTQIKASGGIKTRQFAEDLIAAGANIIGTSNAVDILNDVPNCSLFNH